MSFGDNLKKARIKAGFSQKRLGKEIGLSQTVIYQYEKGERTPKLETLLKIASVLHVNIEDLTDIDTFQSSSDFLKRWNELTESVKENGGDEVKIIYKASPELRINTALDKLNESGKNVAADRVEELTEIKKYQK